MSSNDTSSTSAGSSSVSPTNAADVAHRSLTFWKNGFQLDDGILRKYDDPESARILNTITAGNAPPSVFGVQLGQKVDLRVTNHMNEEYVAPNEEKVADSQKS